MIKFAREKNGMARRRVHEAIRDGRSAEWVNLKFERAFAMESRRRLARRDGWKSRFQA